MYQIFNYRNGMSKYNSYIMYIIYRLLADVQTGIMYIVVLVRTTSFAVDM